MAQIPLTNKKSLKEFNKLEVRGYTIDRLAQIELRIDDIILHHFKPKETTDFKKVLLNNNVLSLGAKVKILKNLKVSGSTLDHITKAMSIRNGFAHAHFTEVAVVVLNHDHDAIETHASTNIEVMSGSGIIKSKPANEYLSEFHNHYLKAIEGLQTHQGY